MEQGWHPDPFNVHEHRYFATDGEATKLVRDAGVESYDDPPAVALADAGAQERVPADPRAATAPAAPPGDDRAPRTPAPQPDPQWTSGPRGTNPARQARILRSFALALALAGCAILFTAVFDHAQVGRTMESLASLLLFGVFVGYTAVVARSCLE